MNTILVGIVICVVIIIIGLLFAFLKKLAVAGLILLILIMVFSFVVKNADNIQENIDLTIEDSKEIEDSEFVKGIKEFTKEKTKDYSKKGFDFAKKKIKEKLEDEENE